MAKKIQRSAPRAAGAAAPASERAAPTDAPVSPRRRRGRIRPGQVTDFTIQLATLTEAGIPIVKALTILEGQMRPGPFKAVLQEVVEDVSSGTPLSEALEKHPRAFDRLYANMVRAGEAGGVLGTVLERQARYQESVQNIKAKVRNATIYPSVIIAVAVLVISAVIIFIIPRFEEIFRSFRVELPRMTQILLDVSRFTVDRWYLVFGLPLALVIAHTVALRRSQPYRYKVHKFLLHVPILGPLMTKGLIAAFSRNFGTLVQAGVPHLDALGIVRDATRNEVLAEGVESIRRTVREGEGIARPMGETGLFDDLVVNMVDVGEATGELDRMLLKVADAYEVQVDRSIDAMFKFVEPMLLIVVAAFVGFIVVALFLPLLEIMNQIGNA
jgi:type IV pilus assembly protein PilC